MQERHNASKSGANWHTWVRTQPITGSCAPTIGVSGAGCSVDLVKEVQKVDVDQSMTLRRGANADGTLAMFVVVPVHPLSHQAQRMRQIVKWFERHLRAILQGREQGVRVRVIVADNGPAT